MLSICWPGNKSRESNNSWFGKSSFFLSHTHTIFCKMDVLQSMLIYEDFSNYCKIPDVNLTAAWVIILKSFHALCTVSHTDISGSLILKRPATPWILASHTKDYLWNLSSLDLASIFIAWCARLADLFLKLSINPTLMRRKLSALRYML